MESGKDVLYGREITRKELQGEEETLEKAFQKSAFLIEQNVFTCRRCGTSDPRQQVQSPCSCGETCFYCVACLNMGKVKKCSMLYSLAEPNEFPLFSKDCLQWKGVLSLEQARASHDIVTTVLEKKLV
ncbi:hypothetical protein LZ578_11195 [Jeotgalibaca sp. MA1X17-3]|uniref:hypothetical protein n=1 Tax=Jeotgalibaca sp. MA1X17-3 TaxID=2908211 RepID=UPI001F1FB4AA|nr:hypothetical protein [Jeotgalibaca sp. MA1X17-3]UJF15512.1 hypothetical protein LZ578_11195 [Jeotgalibaca sp. MA1X17-3]